MKVLHVGDMAGVAHILSRYLRPAGIESRVAMLPKHDPVGWRQVYPEVVDCFPTRWAWYLGVLRAARKVDILHVHMWDAVVWLRQRWPRLRVVLHYHGDELRLDGHAWLRRRAQRYSDAQIVVSTDLLPHLPHAAYVPNPVDTQLFQPHPVMRPLPRALAFRIRYYDPIPPHLLPPEPVTYLDRERAPVPYRQMPYLLRSYRSFVDVKYRRASGLIRPFSHTAVCSLACGRQVWDGTQYHQGFPSAYSLAAVIPQIRGIYEAVLRR